MAILGVLAAASLLALRAMGPGRQTRAILISSPTNQTVFAALADDTLPDLHTVDPADRVLPRGR